MNRHHHVGVGLVFTDDLGDHGHGHVFLVEVQHGFAFCPVHGLLQGGNPVRREVSFGVFQAEFFYFFPGIVGQLAGAVGGAIQRGVMQENDHTVFGQAGVDLEKGRGMVQHIFKAFDGVFRVAGDVRAAVPADDLAAVIGVAEPGADGFEVFEFQAVLLRFGGEGYAKEGQE